MNENKTMTLSAHDGLITALAVSTVNGLVASASHDKFLKLWKWVSPPNEDNGNTLGLCQC